MATTTTQRRSGRSSHPTPEDRIARGKDARVQTPRESHAEFHPGRRDPDELLEHQAANRVPDLVPIRYGRMLASPFTFYRGAALVMAYDLSTTPVSGLTVQACGDAHLSNFGGFASPERELVFDVNDFDEPLPGPGGWGASHAPITPEPVRQDPSARPGAIARPVRARRLRPQGGRRRQRRDPGLDPPPHGPRWPGPAVPPGQGGRTVRARGVRREEQVRQP